MQVCTSLQTDNHDHASTPPLSFLQAGCPSCHPTNSVKALKATQLQLSDISNSLISWSSPDGQWRMLGHSRIHLQMPASFPVSLLLDRLLQSVKQKTHWKVHTNIQTQYMSMYASLVIQLHHIITCKINKNSTCTETSSVQQDSIRSYIIPVVRILPPFYLSFPRKTCSPWLYSSLVLEEKPWR